MEQMKAKKKEEENKRTHNELLGKSRGMAQALQGNTKWRNRNNMALLVALGIGAYIAVSVLAVVQHTKTDLATE